MIIVMKQQQANNQSSSSSSSKMVSSKSSRTFSCSTIFRYSSLLLFLALTVGAEAQGTKFDLVANYTDAKQQLYAFNLGKVFTLTCRPTEKVAITWKKDGKELKTSDNVHIPQNEYIVTVVRGTQEDAGLYECSANNIARNITAVALPLSKINKNSYAIEGEKLTVRCEPFGTDPKVSWRVGNETYTSTDDRIKLSENNQVLEIENITLEDRGYITCIVSNLAGAPHEDQTFVRVKEKYAALWPFLGICAEVFVLCAIILIYEKRRNKLQEAEESDTDSPELKNDQHGKDSDMRHRK